MFKLMTINVWSGLTYRGLLKMKYYETRARREARYQALLASIREQQPDVIGLNEANPCPHYLKRLARDLGYDYCYHMGVSGVRLGRCGFPVNFREGDAILARKSLKLRYRGRKHLGGEGVVRNLFSWHTYDLTQLVLATVSVEGQDVYIGQTHWHNSPMLSEETMTRLEGLRSGYDDEQYRKTLSCLERDERWKMLEAERTVKYLKRKVPSKAPLVLMGDFNAELDWPEMQKLSDDGFVAAEAGYSWNKTSNVNLQEYCKPEGKFDSLYDHLLKLDEQEDRLIDHILVKNCSINESAVCCDVLVNGVHASDHYGVVAQLEI